MAGGLSNGDNVRRFYEGWNSGDIDFAELVAEDIVNHQPEAEPARGRSRFADAIRGVMAAVPDSRWTISDVLTDGDRVAVRITWSGTYGAPQFRGCPSPHGAASRQNTSPSTGWPTGSWRSIGSSGTTWPCCVSLAQWKADSSPFSATDIHFERGQVMNLALTCTDSARREGFEPPTARSVVWCSIR